MNTTTGTTPDIPILHEDSHLLVIVKPAGLLSQRDRTGDPDLLTLCRRYLEQKQQRSESQFLGLLHRLDRPVQGVMRSEEHTSELQSRGHLVCRLLPAK